VVAPGAIQQDFSGGVFPDNPEINKGVNGQHIDLEMPSEDPERSASGSRYRTATETRGARDAFVRRGPAPGMIIWAFPFPGVL